MSSYYRGNCGFRVSVFLRTRTWHLVCFASDFFSLRISSEGSSREKLFRLLIICLAMLILESPNVARLRTTAEKTKDGNFYIVNGTKKWITVDNADRCSLQI
jgi:alkylation response protein AidB-like acyl-CoA dehydrogenase